jgi:NADPH:quinone reductase-like Zn-dependent oxidoreductase
MPTSRTAALDGGHTTAHPVADRTTHRTETMKAIVRDRYGPPDVLELREIAKPSPKAGHVLVSTRAASLFAGDVFLIRGRPLFVRLATGLLHPRQPVPGVDVAGIVEEVGDGVTDLRPGDEVFGWSAGTLAEYVCDSADHFVARPANLTLAQAAAVPEAGMTALQGLRDAGRLQPGHRALIIGASGGVGSFAVQIAKALGAEVTGVSSDRNVELVRSIGADHVIDYTLGDITMTDGRYDVILQAAGTTAPGRLRRLLTRDGTLVLSSGQGRLNGVDRIVKALATSAFVSQRLVTFVTRENRTDLLTLKELVEAGKVAPVIDRSSALADAPDAIRYVATGHTRGKVVVTTRA